MRAIVTPIVIIILGVCVVFQGMTIGNLHKSLEEYEETAIGLIEIAEHEQSMTEEALDMVDTWKTGYTELQEEHSQALEYIEQLEYETEMWINEN